jgi:hypothetical protein
MNYLRLGLAVLGGLVAHFAVGFLIMWLVPALFEEGHKYPAVFRPKEEMLELMPIMMLTILGSILVAAVIFAKMPQTGSGIMQGLLLGLLMGILAVCATLHNYVNLNFGLKLALGQAAAYFVQWMVIGIVIGLIYKPAP